MSDSTVAILESTDPTAKKIDNEQLTVGANTVQRQRIRAFVMAAGDEVDGHSVTLGATTDAEASGNGSIVALLKRLRTLLAGGLPAALSGNGALKVEQVVAGPTQPVSGTFWQATQPVSGTVTANAGTNLNTSALALDATLTGRTMKGQITDGTRDGTVKAASTLPLATDTAVVVTARDAVPVTDNAGSLTVDAPVGTPVFARLSDGAAALVGQKVAASSLPTVLASDVGLPTGANTIGTTLGPTLTKGTQGATGYSVQELKDAGRVNIMWTAEFSPAAIAEALLTITESRDGAATSTFTTKVVTNGKRLRITSIDLVVENTLGVNPKRAKLRLRFNTAGAVTTASPLQGTWAASVSTAVNTIGQTMFADFPDGIEYVGDGTKQIGWTLEFPDWVTAAQTGKVYITIFGFEY